MAFPLAAVALGVNALMNLYGSKKASDASQKAAGQQMAAATRASDLAERMYADSKALNAPLMNTGANRTLQSLTSPGQANVGGRGVPVSYGNAPKGLMAMGSQAQPPQYGAPASGLTAGMMRGDMASGQGGMVRLQAPDGSVREVPAGMAQQFIARGARRVS